MSGNVEEMIVELQADLSQFKKQMDEAGSTAKQGADGMEKGFGKLPKMFGALGTVAMGAIGGIATAIVGVTTAIGVMNNEIEKSMGKYQASTGATEAEAKKQMKNMKDIYANGWGESVDEVTNYMSILDKSLGKSFDGYEKQITEGAFVLRDTFGVEAMESGRAIDSMVKQFDLKNPIKAMDTLTYAMQHLKGDSGEIADSYNEYSVQFKQLGFNLEDMTKSFQQAQNEGVFSLDKVGDAMKEFSIRAIDGSKTTEDAFKSLGFNSSEMQKKFAAGGEEGKKAFHEVSEALKGIKDPAEQSRIAVELFGTQAEDLGVKAITSLDPIAGKLEGLDGSSKKAGDALSNNLGSKIETIKRSFMMGFTSEESPIYQFMLDLADMVIKVMPKIQEGIKKVTDWISDTFKALDFTDFLKSIKKTFDKLKGSFEGSKEMKKFVSEIGRTMKTAQKIFQKVAPIIMKIVGDLFGYIIEIAAPIMKGLMKIVGQALEKINDFWDENGDMIIQAVKNAWAIISGIIETVMPVIKFIIEEVLNRIWNTLSFILDKVMAAVKIFAALLTGDWDKLWEGIKDFFMSFVDYFMSFFTTGFVGKLMTKFGEFTYNMINKAVEWIENTKKKISDGFTLIKDWVLNKLHDIFIEGPKKLGDAVIQMALAIYNKQEELKKKVRDMIAGAISTIASKVSEFYTKGKDFVNNIIWGLVSKGTELYNNFKSIIQKGVNAIYDKVGDFKDGAKNLIDGLLSGLRKYGDAIYDKFLSLAKSGWQAFKDFFHIKSPSRLMREAGNYIGEGVILGLGDQEKNVADTSLAMAEKLYAPFDEDINVGINKPSMDSALRNAGLTANALIKSQKENKIAVELNVKGELTKLFDEVEARIVDKVYSSVGGSL